MFLIKLYKPFVVVVLVMFILIDIFFITEGNLFSYVRLAIKIILIIMIFTNNKYVYTGVKFWSILFLLLVPSIQIIARVVKYILGDYELVIYKQILFIVIGIIIYYGLKYFKPPARV